MANSENLFSVTFRGFSRAEVIAYINEMNRSYQNTGSQYEARIEALNRELDSLRQLKEQNERISAENAEKSEQCAALADEIERLKNDVENQRRAIAAQGEQALEAQAEIERLKTELEAANRTSAAMEANAKEYDAMLADVNNILSTARRKAEELVDEAGKKAEEIVASAEKLAKDNANRILAESDEKLSENMKKVKYLYRRQDELAEIFKQHKAKVDSFFSSLGNYPPEK